MKTRIISGVCYAALVVAVLFFMQTPVLAIFISLVSSIAVYELNHVAKVPAPIAAVSIAVGAFIPLDVEYDILAIMKIPAFTALTVYVLAVLIMMIAMHSKVKFENVAVSVFSALCASSALSCWIKLKDIAFDFDGKYTQSHALYIILFALFSSWFTDTFAYFTGVFFGKHKMTPVISPKKTWEGAIGGVLLTAGANIALFFIFKLKFFDVPFPDWDWYMIIPISVILSVISMLGDLSASVIKRNYGVKDYGKIIPGHGGVMDRFDSIVFVLPAMYAIISIINAI